MTAPQALIEFFQKEATEYLDRLDQLLVSANAPDAATFLASARALRGSATMTRLEGLPDFASTLERIATGLRDSELRWDQRLHFAVRGALAELRGLVERAPVWADGDQRRARTQSVALASVASGYLATKSPAESHRHCRWYPSRASTPTTECPRSCSATPRPPSPWRSGFAPTSPPPPTVWRARRRRWPRARRGHRSWRWPTGSGARCWGSPMWPKATAPPAFRHARHRMARAPLASGVERAGVQAVAQLLMNRELTDTQLAAQVKQANVTWNGTPAPDAAIVSIETLLYRGHSAVTRAREVRDQLKVHWQRGSLAQPEAHALFEELSDLLDLAGTT
jgi:chemotaxis protein histidine kinase CheA